MMSRQRSRTLRLRSRPRRRRRRRRQQRRRPCQQSRISRNPTSVPRLWGPRRQGCQTARGTSQGCASRSTTSDLFNAADPERFQLMVDHTRASLGELRRDQGAACGPGPLARVVPGT